MEIIINGRFLDQRVSGVQRFAREIIGAAEGGGAWHSRASLLVPSKSGSPANFAGMEVRRCGPFAGHGWEQVALAQLPRDSLLVNLCNTAPLLRRQQIVVLHDAAVAAQPQNFTLAFRLWYQMAIRAYSRSAARLATVSRYSADEIEKHFGFPARNIEIIGESGEHILRHEPDYSLHQKFGLEEGGYFLAASSWAPNKNFARILEAVSRLPSLPYKFVIVGGRNDRVFRAASVDSRNAISVGYASDGQLRALYERAACFVYPSLYEGFGLPPLEAMCCGCPVLVSNTTSMPEVCGDAAMYCDPDDVDDIARQLASLLGSREAQAELREAGFARAREWTWMKAAHDLGQLVNSVG